MFVIVGVGNRVRGLKGLVVLEGMCRVGDLVGSKNNENSSLQI